MISLSSCDHEDHSPENYYRHAGIVEDDLGDRVDHNDR